MLEEREERIDHSSLNPEELMELHRSLKLGRNPRKPGAIVLPFKKYKIGALPAAPATCSYIAASIVWAMLLNDTLGDCTCAGYLHMVQAWCAAAGVEFNPTNAMALWLYEKACGYVPGDPSTDQGGNEVDVLNFCRKNGVDGKHKIVSFVEVDTETAEMNQALFIFGGLYTGLAMPLAWQGSLVWDAPPKGQANAAKWKPGSWGGHCPPFLAYDAENNYTPLTWGSTAYRITAAAVAVYCDERYAPVSKDFLNASGVDLQGLDLAQLEADSKQIAA